MTKTTASPRYTDEVLAWEYDQRNQTPTSAEIAWYLKYATQTVGPLLELACGSGRLLLPLARAGYIIDGVDNAPAMLARLHTKMETFDQTTRSRIRTFCDDMLEFVPQQQYSLVLIGYNSITYLMTRARMVHCFHRVHQWLQSGGILLFMVQRIDPAMYRSGPKVVDWLAQPLVDPERGIAVGSKFVTYLEPGDDRLVKERTYHITEPSCALRVVESVTYTPLLTHVAYVTMLQAAGFAVKVYNDYTEEEVNDTTATFCFVCYKASS